VEVRVTPLKVTPVWLSDIEIVERKGLGHPDTICDALAEALSVELCRVYMERFGFVLHHNVDKNLLVGGSALPEFGGGKVVKPIEVFLSGRAVKEYKGVKIPVDEIAVESARRWFKENIHAIDPERHVRIHTYIRPGSVDLVDIYMRQLRSGVPLSNDTSFGVGFAPFDDLENIVYHIEKELNSQDFKASNPEVGEDIKVMGVRIGERIKVTVACAFVDRFISSIKEYVDRKEELMVRVKEIATRYTDREVEVYVNTGDDVSRGNVYITVTGTSSEAGDDGEVGRGNRVNGLITPYRPMSLEAAAGKNPITHVGKLYNITAREIAVAVVESIPDVREAYCYMVSQIGKPVNEPMVVDVRLRADACEPYRATVEEIVNEHLSGMADVWRRLVDGEITVY
jgi:S-adenosylmethionine synthetase